MYKISDDFTKTSLSTEREIKGYVEVLYGKSYILENSKITNTIELIDIQPYLYVLRDQDRKGKNYASLEQDYFKLDGSFVLPNNEIYKNPGIGFVSKKVFGEDSTIKEKPIIIELEEIIEEAYEFIDERYSNGVTIYFQDNVPTDIEIKVYTKDNEYTYNIDDCIIQEDGTLNLIYDEVLPTKFEITIKDMLYKNRRLRIQEIDGCISKLYKDSELISFKTINQIDRKGTSVPIGECIIELGDYEGKFDPTNPKGISKYLNSNVNVTPYVGMLTNESGIEYCPMGIYSLESYKYDNAKVTFTCKDFMTYLQEKSNVVYYYADEDRQMLYSLHSSHKYKIHVNLDYGEETIFPIEGNTELKYSTGLENLQKILLLSNYIGVLGRKGNSIYYLDEEYMVYRQDLDVTYNMIKCKNLNDEIPKLTINRTLLKKEPEVTENDTIKSIKIKEYQYSIDNYNQEILYESTILCDGDETLIYDYGMPVGTTTQIICDDYSKLKIYAARNHIYDKNGNLIYEPTIGGTLLTYSYAKINYTGNVTFRITKQIGYKLNDSENVIELADNGTEISIDNDIVNGRLLSTYLANNYLSKNSSKTFKFAFNGNPELDCGDIIEIEDKYLDENNNIKYNKVFITKIENEFKGSFNQTIEGDII